MFSTLIDEMFTKSLIFLAIGFVSGILFRALALLTRYVYNRRSDKN